MKNSLYACTLLFLSATVFGQQTETSHPLERLTFMVGEWQGTGWMMTQTGKIFNDVWENIECKLDCHVFAVDGLGTMTDSITGETTVTHDAFGIISYNPEAEAIQLRAYKEDSVTVSYIDFIEDRIIRWGFETPGGFVRFTTDFSVENKWSAIGEFSRDGQSWMQFLETQLTRVE
jgi:hypothetical protein